MPLIDLHAFQEEAGAEAAKRRSVRVADAAFPVPFPVRLLSGCPAHGTWTIVHMALLVPESHSVFVCAQGCLRGCSMSAFELGFERHFSTVSVEDANLLDGDAETVLIEGVSEVLDRLPKKPRAMLVYTSCVHHYMGTDVGYCLRRLSELYPEVDFLDCYMTPVTREEMAPDVKQLKQTMNLIPPLEPKEGAMVAGGLLPLAPDSEIAEVLRLAGEPLLEIPVCRDYGEFKRLGRARALIWTTPVAAAAAETGSWRLGVPAVSMHFAACDKPIRESLEALCGAMKLDPAELGLRSRWDEEEKAGGEAFRRVIGELNAAGASVAIDQTATPRPLSLARRIIEEGGRVSGLYLDLFLKEEKEDFEWLRTHAPDLLICTTTGAEDRFRTRKAPDGSTGPVVAIGQRAAWYTGTRHFVNMVWGADEEHVYFGWSGLSRLAGKIEEALRTERDPLPVIGEKALGCRITKEYA